jgi:hypothetical protein
MGQGTRSPRGVVADRRHFGNLRTGPTRRLGRTNNSSKTAKLAGSSWRGWTGWPAIGCARVVATQHRSSRRRRDERAGARKRTVGYESKDPSRKLIRTILGAISEYDRDMIADRLESARKPRRRGGWLRTRRAALRLPQRQRTVGAARARADRPGADDRATQRGCQHPPDRCTLTAEGHPTNRGGEWSSPTTSRILARQDTLPKHQPAQQD